MWSGSDPCIACVLKDAVEAYYMGNQALVNQVLKQVHQVFKDSKSYQVET